MIARALWVLPLLLLAIGVSLVRSALEIRHTLVAGEAAIARVTAFEAESRAEITYGHVELAARLRDGTTLTEDVPLPLSLLYFIEGQDSVQVRILPSGSKRVVIEQVARAQWHMALIHAGMSLFGALLLAWGVGAWNRYLKRNGDPARRDRTADQGSGEA